MDHGHAEGGHKDKSGERDQNRSAVRQNVLAGVQTCRAIEGRERVGGQEIVIGRRTHLPQKVKPYMRF